MFNKTTLLLLTFICQSLMVMSQYYENTPSPDWVRTINPKIESTFSKYDVNNGVYTSLFDNQYDLSTGSVFVRTIDHVISNAGISNASEIYISYDTAYQKLQFHYLYIWRRGKKIDRTKDLTFETLQNERNLESSMYSGQITSYDILDDIRNGDKIECAYTIVGDNPIFDDYKLKLLPLQDSNPIDYLSISLYYPSNSNYQYECVGCEDLDVTENTLGNTTTVQVIGEALPASDIEASIPSWYVSYNHLIISNYDSWKNVSNWATSVFSLTEKQDLNEIITEYLTDDMTLDEKIDGLINFVQDDIRFMGIESGIGSIKPFTPNQVIKQRYGDCKDKSLLLVMLLAEVGVDTAYPALVNTGLRQGVAELMPGGQLFDHCIVYLEHEGEEYWIDPTISLQGGSYKNIAISDYKKALVVRADQSGLKDMNIDPKRNGIEVYEHFDIPSFTESGKLTVITKLYGMNADHLRNAFEYMSTKDISDSFKDNYSLLFPNIEIAEKLGIDDNLDSNIIIIKEYYNISDLWIVQDVIGEKKISFSYEPVEMYNYISNVSCESKKEPVEIPYPSQYKQETIFNFPSELNFGNEIEDVSNSALEFKKISKQLSKRSISIIYTFETITNEISAGEFPKVCKDINTAVNNLPLLIFYPVPRFFE